jgi:hypothetical protein
MQLMDYDIFGFAGRPIAAVLIALALLTVALNLYKAVRTPEPG